MESVILELKIRNPSILIQEFGFLNLPESIRIKPSFGEIIPGEEITLEVYFSAEKAQIYNCIRFSWKISVASLTRSCACDLTSLHSPRISF